MKKVLSHVKMRMVQFRYDKTGLFYTFVFPIVLVFGLGYFFLENTADKPYGVQVVNNFDNEKLAHEVEQLKTRIAESRLFELKGLSGDLDKYQELLRNEKLDVLINVVEGDVQYKYEIIYLKKGVMSEAVFMVLSGFLEQNKSGSELVVAKPISKNQYPYIYTILPGGIGLILLLVGLMGLGAKIVEERDVGILKKIQTVDRSPFYLLSGLLVSRAVIAIMMVMVMMVMAYYLFNMQITGSYVIFVLSLVLVLMSFFGISIILSCLAKNFENYNGYVQVIQLPFIVLGGVFFSISVLPEWLQDISKYSPLTAFVLLFNKLLTTDVKIGEFYGYMTEISVLLVWGVLTFVVGLKLFRWSR